MEDWQGFEAEGTMGLDYKGEIVASAKSQTSAMKTSPCCFQLAVLSFLIRLSDQIEEWRVVKIRLQNACHIYKQTARF